jgi:hypothetical protein
VGIELSDDGLRSSLQRDQRLGHRPDASVLEKTEAYRSIVGKDVEAVLNAKAGANSLKRHPPVAGEKLFILILTREERRTNILGDLAEEYCELAEKFGERFATIWYYKQVAASVLPLIRKAAKWSLPLWAGALIRKFTH